MTTRRQERRWVQVATTLLVAALLALAPTLDEHDARDTHGPIDGSIDVAVDAVHGTQSAHFETSRVRPHRQCSACLASGSSHARVLDAAAGPRPAQLEHRRVEFAQVAGLSELYPAAPSRAPPHLL